MASAASLPIAFDRLFKVGFAHIDDPGASGTFYIQNKGIAIAEVVTVGAESRVLPAADAFGVGQTLAVVFKTDGGDLTVTGADVSVVFKDAGDYVVFVVSNNNGTLVWRIVQDSRAESNELGTKNIELPIDDNWRNSGTLTTNLGTGGGATTVLGLTSGTFLTSNPTLVHTETNPTASSRNARRMVAVPNNYAAGSDLTLKITVTEGVAATAATIDAQVVRQAAPTVDINATAAQSVLGAAATVYSFTLTGTNVVPGDVLDINVDTTLTHASASPSYSISKVELSYSAG